MTRATPLVVVIAVVLVAGCARYYYGKPAGSYSDFRDDSIACARDVGIASGNGQYAAVSPHLFRRCMVAKGWEREKQIEPDQNRWFRGVESDEPIDLVVGPKQPETAASAGSEIFCRARHLDGRSDWRDRLPAYRECVGR